MINIKEYRRFIPLSIASICFLILYYQVIYQMILDWANDDNYSHGFLIPVIAGYLIWQDRERLSDIHIKPSNSGIIFLILSLLFFIITNIGAELFTMRFSMLLVILSMVVYFAGWEFGKALSLPVAYLVFMIPLPAILWNKIAFPLKLFATKIAVGVIAFLGITVYGEGNIIHLSNTTLEVVDACSGLRSLTSLLALSAAFALITDHSKLKKFIIFISAIPIAILVNIFRLSATAVLAKSYGPQVAQGFLHEASGIIVFIIAFLLLYAVHWGLDKLSHLRAPHEENG